MEWVNKLAKEKVPHFFFISPENVNEKGNVELQEDLAKEVCQRYLKTIDKSQWPILLGSCEIMDIILDEEFKKL